MITLNARVEHHGMRLSEGESKEIYFWLSLGLEGGAGVQFSIIGSTNADEPDSFGSKIKALMDILEVDDAKDIDGKPLRAIFDAPNGGSMLGAKIIGVKNFLNDDTLEL